MASKTSPETAAASNVVDTDDDGWETLVEEYGETWTPETAGDELIGTYTASREIDTTDVDGNPRKVTVYEIEDRSGKKWSVWSSHNVDLAFKGCIPTDQVKLVFMGTVPLDGGRSVKTYRIYRKSA